MTRARPRALVIGGGVSGLTVGLELARRGFAVRILAREHGARTTSGVAAAIWYPYKAGPLDAVGRWARASYDAFVDLATVPESGVLMRSGFELLPGPGFDMPWRKELVDLRPARAGELPKGYAHGFVCRVPVVEMPLYLRWLESAFRAAAGELESGTVRDLADCAARAELVVNCAGLGARELCADRALVPVRGQIVRVERRGVERFVLDDYNPAGITYVVPRARDCVLGGSSDEGRDDLLPDERESAAILARCGALEPALLGARVESVAVGLRPYRPAVRVERERLGSAWLVHDYGHGGAGVTLSWGCAREAADLAGAVFPECAPNAATPRP